MKTYKVTIDEEGTERWYNDQDQCHCEHGPAAIYSDGSKYWYINGNRHNENGPAAIYTDGSKYWYLNNIEYKETEWKEKLKETEWKEKLNQTVDMSLEQVIKELGYNIKIVK